MQEKIIEQKQIDRIEYYCDLCNKMDKKTLSTRYECHICKRDICAKHTVFDPSDNSDYPDELCTECYEIGKSYNNKIKEIEAEADNKISILTKTWHKEAKENAKKQ